MAMIKGRTLGRLCSLLGVGTFCAKKYILSNPEAPVTRKKDGSWHFEEDKLIEWWEANKQPAKKWETGEAMGLRNFGKLVGKSYPTMKVWLERGMPAEKESDRLEAGYYIDPATALEWMVSKEKITEEEKADLLQKSLNTQK